MNMVFLIILELKCREKITWIDGIKSFYYLLKLGIF